MRTRAWALLVVAALVVPLQAASYLADEQISIGVVAVGFTTAKITPNLGGGVQAQFAVCRLETAEIRYRFVGTGAANAATLTNGTLLEPGEVLALQGHDVLANFSAIRTVAGAGNATLTCVYSTP